MSDVDRERTTAPPATSEFEPGTLVLAVGDDDIAIDMVGGGSWVLPVGVTTLVDGPLESSDRPRPEQLTNALGAVADELDDVLIEAPIVASAPALVFRGPHAEMVARVELGLDEIPDDYVLRRADADEVFRTIVAEPRAERRHNPGLAAEGRGHGHRRVLRRPRRAPTPSTDSRRGWWP